MDFLDPKKKRAHKIRLYIGYALMAVALGIGTLILVFAAYGYDIDRRTGDVIQNGLIIVDAHPEAATISVNGANKGTTDSRLILPAGKYTVQLHRDGYRDWSHAVNLEGSSIEQLVYPLLFPTKLATRTLQDYATPPSMASESLDHHWLVVQQPESANTFNIVDLNNAKNPITTVNLPTDTFTPAAGAHSYEAVEWASDNNHLLMKHNFTGGSEFVILDRDNPASSLNVNKLFNATAFSGVGLRDKKPDQLYLFNAADGSLSHADTKSKVITPLLQHIISFKSYQDNTLLYVTNPAASVKEVEVHAWQNGQDYLLRTLPIAGTYLLDMAQFNGHFYIAAGSPVDGHTYVYKDAFSDLTRHPIRVPQPFRVLIVSGAQYMSFSAIARFVAVQGGTNFAVYDIETGRQFRYDTKLPLEQNQKAVWVDGHRLSLVSANAINIFDFDGTNMQKLSSGLPAFIPFFDRDYTAMLTVAPSADKTALLRTELKVLPANSTSQ